MSDARMTRRDLYQWVMANGCKQKTLDEDKAKLIYFKNPEYPDNEAWLNLPLDERPVKAYTACLLCSSLRIPIPEFADYMKETVTMIKNKHIRKKPKW